MSTAEQGRDESFHVRPRFREEVSLTCQQVEDRLKAALEAEGTPCKGSVHPGHARIKLPAAERHYWSPELQLSFEATENGTLVRGLFGPRPQVWTLFVLFYSIIGFAALILLVVGMSYMTLGKDMSLFWGFPVLALIFLSLYLVAYFGQRKGRDQMIRLYRFFEKTIYV